MPRLDFFPIPFLIGTLALAVFLFILWRQKRSAPYLICWAIFGVYLLLVIGVVVFPIPLPSGADRVMTPERVSFILSMVNFVPFSYYDFAGQRTVFREIAQNILLTIPFGFGASFIRPRRARRFLWLGLTAGLSIEVTQLMLSLTVVKGAYRTIDITDVILNAAGVLLGYGLFRLFAWLYLAGARRLALSHEGLAAYVFEVVSQEPIARTKSS